MKTALLTGSESFGNYMVNPSKWLALSARGKIILGHEIHSLVFPTFTLLPEGVEDTGTIIVKKAIEINADVIISFGSASEAKGFRIARSAYNWIENTSYCQPYENFRLLDTKRPAKEQRQIDMSKWNLELIETLFKEKNVPFDPKVSDDPGRFSCNAMIYRTILALEKLNVNIPYVFVHFACTEESIELIPEFPRDKKTIIPKEYLQKALAILLQSYI